MRVYLLFILIQEALTSIDDLVIGSISRLSGWLHSQINGFWSMQKSDQKCDVLCILILEFTPYNSLKMKLSGTIKQS